MWRGLVPAIVAVGLVTAGEARAAEDQPGDAADKKRVAVLPAEAADAALAEQVTGLTWDALARRDDVIAHDLLTTRAELADAASMGLACAPDDTTCLTKLAILLRVDQLLVVQVTSGEGGAELSLSLLDASAATMLSDARGELPEGGAERVVAVRALVDELLRPFGEPEPAPEPKPEESEGDADVASPDDGAAPDGLFLAGAALAGGGAVVALAAGAGAGAIDATLSFSDVGETKQDRENLLLTERVLAVVAVVGVAAAGVGAALVVLSWGSE